MIIAYFIRLRWKEMSRSNIWQRNIAANIAIGFLVILMFFYLLMLGFFLDPILRKLYPEQEPAAVFNSILLYYFMFDLLIRYLMQGLPTFDVESFLHLPVKRTTVVHFILIRTGLHLLNFLPLLVFIPFAVTGLATIYTSSQIIIWLLSLIFLIFMNNFIATYLKRQLVSKAWVTGLAALALIGITILDGFGIIKLTDVSGIVFSTLTNNPILLLTPFALMCLAYMLQFRFLLARMYPEEIIRRKVVDTSDIPRIKYLESMGLTGDLIMLEMKLWWRHKRTRSMLYLLPLFVLYGFFFYPQKEYNSVNPMLIFVGIFMSGGLMMNYLNYAFGYESNYFDGILTRKIDMTRYIKAKMTIGLLICTFCYIITVPYVFFGPHILLINTVTYLFNIGFLSYLLLFLATYNKLKMDLSKSSSFNYQGVSAMNWLVLFPAFLFPVIIFLPFYFTHLPYIGLAIIGLIGITGFLFRKYWIRQITGSFFSRKYIMAEGFRGN
jgi:hypothetical protein